MTDVLARTTNPVPDNPDGLRVRAVNRVALAGHRLAFRFGRAVNALSECGARFVAEFEGLFLHPYDDPVGLCTVGIGHLLHYSRCNGTEASLPDDKAAWDLLVTDMATSYVPALDAVVVQLTQQQKDCLVSFIFNAGVNGFRSSTLLRLLNQGDYASVPDQLLRWNKAGGQPWPGLTRRRQREGTLFANAYYGFPCEPITPARRRDWRLEDRDE